MLASTVLQTLINLSYYQRCYLESCSDSATLESVHLNQPCTLAVTLDEGDILE